MRMTWQEGQAFVGREEELGRLRGWMSDVRDGRPWVVLVEGEPGIGKTTMLRRWLAAPELTGVTVLRAGCDPDEADVPFGVVGQFLARVDRARLQELGLGLAEASIPPGATAFQIGGDLVRLIDALQGAGPVAVAVDDVQWADALSMQALRFALHRLEADALLILLTRRSQPGTEGQARVDEAQGPIERTIRAAERSAHITLGGLDLDAISELAQEHAGRRIEDKTLTRLAEQTEGNPLYLNMILAQTPHPGPLGDAMTVPTTLVAGIRRQLESLPEPARHLVEAAAVLNTPAPLWTVGRIAAVQDPAAALAPALEAGLLRWRSAEPTTPVTIAHALQQKAVIHATAPARLQQLHAAAAQVVERDATWAHRIAASASPDPGLAEELAREAETQAAGTNLERAATLGLWAADMADSRPEQERHLCTATARLLWADDFTRAAPLLTRVEACGPSPLKSLVLGAYESSRSVTGPAQAQLTRALEEAEHEPELRWAAAMAGTWLGLLYTYQGRGTQVAATLQQVLELTSIPDSLRLRARGFLGLGLGFAHGASRGLALFAEAVPMPDAATVTAGDAFPLSIRGALNGWAGRLTQAVDDLTAALGLGSRHGAPVMAEYTYANLAAAQYLHGAWSEATISANHALAVTDAEDKPWAKPPAHAIAAWPLAAQGDWEQAEAHIRAAQQWAPSFGPGILPHVATAKALLAQARGDHTGMRKALRPLPSMLGQGMPLLSRLWWLPLHAHALIATGELAEAGRALAELAGLATDTPPLLVPAGWLTGLLAERQGDPRTALDRYRSAVAVPPGPDDMPLYRAQLQQALGQCLLSTGEHAEAVAALRAAQHGFQQLRARPYLERCEAALAAAQERALHPALHDAASEMTVRELDIAHLVERGMTNKEIAAELFISTKTVEYHLGHIFTRAHITSRRQLRELMRAASV
ncbi:ATP-binding protein [Streptomyces sp. NPDC101151]|uniref:ATP-binding protein n=1 Tax=Streptomyces sp. NPDC101151 TaxID=3366115 RepID=UPI00382B2B96